MDWVSIGKRVQELFEKYKFVLLIIILGIVFMTLPGKTDNAPVPETKQESVESESVEEQLEQILSQIRGVGKVRVMLTEQTGPETVYQVDTDRTEGEETQNIRQETVILSGNGAESGLIRTVTPPIYLGAVVVCQGAGSPEVRLAVSGAVAALTGIGTDRIAVLEMK